MLHILYGASASFLSHLWSLGLPFGLQFKAQSFQMLTTVILRDHTVYQLDQKHAGTTRTTTILMPVAAGSMVADLTETELWPAETELLDNY